jgi:class 3 adenylate cyclase
MSSERDKPSRVEYLKALCRTVPYHVVEAVLAKPAESAVVSQAFEGSILHADLVGFTGTCERLANEGPEGLTKVTDMLNGLFGQLLEMAIFPHSGYVIEFGGDSLSAVFRGSEHAWRAAAAGGRIAPRPYVGRCP